MAEVKLKKKICLKRKEKTAEFVFTKYIKIKLLWKKMTMNDPDLCVFFKTKDGQVGGVFSSMFRQKKSDMGSLEEFPYMEHMGDNIERSEGNESVLEQINVSNLDNIDTANVVVLDCSTPREGEYADLAQARGSGYVEIQSSEGDYFEIAIDPDKSGIIYHVCSIKNRDGINSVVNEGVMMDLGTAFERIPGFSLICVCE